MQLIDTTQKLDSLPELSAVILVNEGENPDSGDITTSIYQRLTADGWTWMDPTDPDDGEHLHSSEDVMGIATRGQFDVYTAFDPEELEEWA